MPTYRHRRGPVGGLPIAADGELLLTTDQNRIYVGDSGNKLVGLLHKIDATTAPGTGDDAADGYSVGSTWVNVTTDRCYTCVDSTTGAAVWAETGNRVDSTVPSTATSTGTAGDIRYDNTHLYICTATNTWRRVAISSW